jgi:hypothetical protein
VPSAKAFALVLAVALAASVSAVRGGFVYDDVPVVRDDPRLASLNNLPTLVATPYWSSDFADRMYRPLVTASFAFDRAVGGGSPVVPHAVNVVLHLAVTALVLLLAGALLDTRGAVVAALWFAVHPVHVEAFAPIVGRSEVLAAVGYLGAVLAYAAEWRAARAAPGGARRGLLAVLVLVGAAVAFASKEHALTLPLMLLLVDAWTARWAGLRVGAVLRQHALLWAGVAALAAGYLAARGAVLGTVFGGGTVAPGLEGLGWGGRLAVMLPAFLEWARLLVVPVRLSADYAPNRFVPSTGLDAVHVAGALLIAAIAVGAWRLRRRLPGLALGVVWFAVVASVAANVLFPTAVLVGERLLYLPSVGAALTGVVLVLLAARSLERITVWRNPARFLAARAVDAPDSYRTHWELGSQAFDRGEPRTGERELLAAARIWPYDASLLAEIGRRYLAVGALSLADRFSTAAYALDTLQSGAAAQSILARLRAGAVDSAVALARTALRRDPTNEVLAYAAFGAFDRGGEPQRVLAAARVCALAHPEDGALQVVAADAARRLGHCAEARVRLARAHGLALSPGARDVIRERLREVAACRPDR